MRASGWMGVVAAGLVMVGGCQRDDTMGGVAGDDEGAVPAGAIPAPTQGGVDDAPVSAPPGGAGVVVDSAVTPEPAATAADTDVQ